MGLRSTWTGTEMVPASLTRLCRSPGDVITSEASSKSARFAWTAVVVEMGRNLKLQWVRNLPEKSLQKHSGTLYNSIYGTYRPASHLPHLSTQPGDIAHQQGHADTGLLATGGVQIGIKDCAVTGKTKLCMYGCTHTCENWRDFQNTLHITVY